MTACSSKEEATWRTRLTQLQTDKESGSGGTISSLDLDIKSIGCIVGQPGMIMDANKTDAAALTLALRKYCSKYIDSSDTNRRRQALIASRYAKKHAGVG